MQPINDDYIERIYPAEKIKTPVPVVIGSRNDLLTIFQALNVGLKSVKVICYRIEMGQGLPLWGPTLKQVVVIAAYNLSRFLCAFCSSIQNSLTEHN